MEYLIKEEKLELFYKPGKGAWTYHLRIPNSQVIEGKWGDIKVSGCIDDYKLEARNLAPVKGEDKMLSINSTIRKAINKGGGDTVNVTLYLVSSKKQITETEIREIFKDAGVLEDFTRLSGDERNAIIARITSIKSEEMQVKALSKFIDQLGKRTSSIIAEQSINQTDTSEPH